MTYALPAGHVGHRHQLLKLAVFDVPGFIPPLQFLEEEKRNEFGAVIVGDPVSGIRVVEFVQIEIILAKVQRLCNRFH